MNTDKENNSYELHYELADENCHIMNAEVESASTVTFLKAVNYISNAKYNYSHRNNIYGWKS